MLNRLGFKIFELLLKKETKNKQKAPTKAESTTRRVQHFHSDKLAQTAFSQVMEVSYFPLFSFSYLRKARSGFLQQNKIKCGLLTLVQDYLY